MKIIYTQHALMKIDDLAELGLFVSKSLINKIIRKPLGVDSISDLPNKIIVGGFDTRHVLLIVCLEKNDKIIVITFYPGRRERYL